MCECELNFIVRHCCAAASERRVVAASNVKKPSGTHCLLIVDMIQRPRVGREFVLKYPSAFLQKFTDARELRRNAVPTISGMGDSGCSNKANEPKTDTFSSAPTSIPRILNN